MSLTVYYPSLDDPARQARLDRGIGPGPGGPGGPGALPGGGPAPAQIRPALVRPASGTRRGQNLEYLRMLGRLRREPDLLEGCTGGLLVDGPGELVYKIRGGGAGPGTEHGGVRPGGAAPWWRPPAPWPTSGSRPKTWGPTCWAPMRRPPGSWRSRWRPSPSPPGSGPICWPSTPPATTPPTPWPCGGRSRSACPPGGRWRRSACATAPCPTAPAVPTPCASTSASGGGCFYGGVMSEAGLPRRAEGGRPHPHVPQLQRRSVR